MTRQLQGPKTKENSCFTNKMHRVMSEYKHHTLHSGSKHGKTVRNRNQAIAIALHEARNHCNR